MDRLYAFGPFELDSALFELRRDGARIPLERRVFDLLVYLIQQRERVVGNDELLERVWTGAAVTPNSLVRAVRLAREALRDPARAPSWITTVRGRGYRFVGDVVECNRAPAAMSGTPETRDVTDPFVGRHHELAQVERLLGDVCAGRGRVYVLSGEPGIGKTRLAGEILARARTRGMEVLSAWCHDGEGAPSYWPWIQLLRAHAACSSTEQLRQDLGPQSRLLLEMIPELLGSVAELVGDLDPPSDEARFQLFDSVSRLFVAAARRRPLLLLLDDLHSADGPSLRLLEFLVREIEAVPLLVLTAHRSAVIDVPPRVRETLAGIGGHRYCARVELGGLGADEIRDLAVAAGLCTLDHARVEQIRARTGGNPLFVRELVRSVTQASPRLNEIAVPSAVRDVLSLRLTGLSAHALGLLQAASIVGSEWPEDLVRAVSEFGSDEASGGLQEAIASGIIRPLPSGFERFGFAHALFRETLYTDLRSDRRRTLHRRAVVWLASERGALEPAEVAHHAYHSAALDQGEAALHWTLRAAEHAMASFAYEDAAKHYARALELVDRFPNEREPRERCALLVGLAEARMAGGDRAAATKVFGEAARIAQQLRLGPLLARIGLGLAPGLMSIEYGLEHAELAALLRSALELCSNDVELCAQLQSRLALALMWRTPRQEARALAERAIALAHRAGSARAESFARNTRCLVGWSQNDLDERLGGTGELLACAVRAGDRELEVVARTCRLLTYLEAGRLGDVQAELAAFDRLALELRQPQALWYRFQFRACIAYLQGRFAEARRFREEFARIAERACDINSMHAAAAIDIMLAWEEDRPWDALAILDQVRRVHDVWDNVHALGLARCGRLEEASELLRTLCRGDSMREPDDIDWLVYMVNRVEACVLVGDRELAEQLYTQLLPYRSRVAIIAYGSGCWGSMERAVGMLAALLRRWPEAKEHFEAALHMNRKLGARPFVARTQYSYARMLQERDAPGDRGRANGMLAESLAEARILGMTALAAQLAALP